jgi:hypothetical protein
MSDLTVIVLDLRTPAELICLILLTTGVAETFAVRLFCSFVLRLFNKIILLVPRGMYSSL